jgi:hypothetical protein
MQSPINTPINQQLHVTTGQQMVQSPPQQQQMGYSPKNNPISPPVIHSPHFKQQHVKPQQQHTNQKTYINENMGTAATNYTVTDGGCIPAVRVDIAIHVFLVLIR